jgi:hypothetical protein
MGWLPRMCMCVVSGKCVICVCLWCVWVCWRRPRRGNARTHPKERGQNERTHSNESTNSTHCRRTTRRGTLRTHSITADSCENTFYTHCRRTTRRGTLPTALATSTARSHPCIQNLACVCLRLHVYPSYRILWFFFWYVCVSVVAFVWPLLCLLLLESCVFVSVFASVSASLSLSVSLCSIENTFYNGWQTAVSASLSLSVSL